MACRICVEARDSTPWASRAVLSGSKPVSAGVVADTSAARSCPVPVAPREVTSAAWDEDGAARAAMGPCGMPA